MAWHGGDLHVALLRCNGHPGWHGSSLQVVCVVGSGLSHLYLPLSLKQTLVLLAGSQICLPEKENMEWSKISWQTTLQNLDLTEVIGSSTDGMSSQTFTGALAALACVPLHFFLQTLGPQLACDQRGCKTYFNLNTGLWTTEHQSSSASALHR